MRWKHWGILGIVLAGLYYAAPKVSYLIGRYGPQSRPTVPETRSVGGDGHRDYRESRDLRLAFMPTIEPATQPAWQSNSDDYTWQDWFWREPLGIPGRGCLECHSLAEVQSLAEKYEDYRDIIHPF